MKEISSPSADEFPKYSEKAAAITNMLAIRLTFTSQYKQFSDSFGVLGPTGQGSSMIGSAFYSLERSSSDLMKLVENSSNVYAVAQLIEFVKRVDSTAIHPEKMVEFKIQRANIFEKLEEFVKSDVWMKYVNYCDAHNAMGSAEGFQEYVQNEVDASVGDRREAIATYLEKIRANYGLDSQNEKRLFTHDYFETTEIIRSAERISDADSLSTIIEFHAHPEYKVAYGGPSTHVLYIETASRAIESLSRLDEKRLTALRDNFLETRTFTIGDIVIHNEESTYLAMLSSYYLKDYKTFQDIADYILSGGKLSGIQASDTLTAHILELYTSVPGLQLPVEHIHALPLESMQHTLSVVESAQLTEQYIQALLHGLDGNYVHYKELTRIIDNFFAVASPIEKEIVRIELSTRIQEELDHQSNLPESEWHSDDNIPQIVAERLKLYVQVATHLQDNDLLLQCVLSGFNFIGSNRLGTYETVNAMSEAIKELVKEPTYRDKVLDWNMQFYRELEEISLARYVEMNLFDTDRFECGFSLLMTTLEAIHREYPDMDIAVDRGETLLKSQEVIDRVSEYYLWISSGIEKHFRFSFGDVTERSSSTSNQIARSILKECTSTKVKNEVMQIAISRVRRLVESGEYLEAVYYARALESGITGTFVDETDLIRLTSKDNLVWIQNELMPEPSPRSSQYN